MATASGSHWATSESNQIAESGPRLRPSGCTHSNKRRAPSGRVESRAREQTAAWSPPGKPVQNAFIESFNSKLRDECLNEHVFLTLAEARETIEAWRHDYNHLRPHGSLGALTPTEFAALKRQETQTPEEGQTTGGLYL